MLADKDRLELCVTYVAKGVALGIKPSSVQFLDRQPKDADEALTLEGHTKLNEGMSFYINVAEFGIGRSVTNDLFVDSPKISRSHVKIITCADESYELRDLGSANGTSISGR